MEMKPEYNHGTFALKEETFHLLLPQNIIQRLPKQFWDNAPFFNPYRFMEYLNYAHEFALDKWAMANGISEAYRIVYDKPETLGKIVIRIWWHGETAQITRVIAWGYSWSPRKPPMKSIIVQDDRELCDLMREHAPPAKQDIAINSFYSHVFYVERWKEETYSIEQSINNEHAYYIYKTLEKYFKSK